MQNVPFQVQKVTNLENSRYELVDRLFSDGHNRVEAVGV